MKKEFLSDLCALFDHIVDFYALNKNTKYTNEHSEECLSSPRRTHIIMVK